MAEATRTIDLRPRGPGEPERLDAGLVLLAAEPEGSAPRIIRIVDEVILGRAPTEGHPSIDQTAASRVHARIWRDGNRFLLEDRQSRNGTILNGMQITRAHELAEHDEVRIGNAIFKFTAHRDRYEMPVIVDGSGMVIGPTFHATMLELVKIAQTDLPILVLGETGTGKEVVTRSVHAESGRRGKLAAINCAAIPTHLLESELFGHKKGAFTGADRDRVGVVANANKGTLFLDEIGDLPLEAQAKLLRLLETREVVPVGANEGEKIDVRIVSATHKNLATLVEKGSFRADLLSRLRGHVVRLPPLSERKEEILALAKGTLEREGKGHVSLGFDFVVGLLHYDWPYNVRELVVAMRRALAIIEGPTLSEAQLPEGVRESLVSYGKRDIELDPTPESVSPNPRATEGSHEPPSKERLESLMREHQGNIAGVARALSRDRSLVHRWLKRHQLDPATFR